MKCPNCGADGDGRFCEYCGSELPKPQQAKTINITNNYYGGSSQQTYEQRSQQRSFYADSASSQNANASDKNRWIALVLCILIGGLGAHHFYVGRVGMGILYLLTGGLVGIGILVDFILILLGQYKDKQGRYLK